MNKIYILALFLITASATKAQVENIILDTSHKEVVMEEVVIAATRFPENKKFVAQQVQVLTAKKMQFFNQPTTAELLTQSGNVFVQKSQLGGGSPVIRGFEANKVLIVVDGIRMNNAIFRGGHLQNIISMDNAILERTEILFGPASVMYGSDALGGVMSFTTKNPTYITGKQNDITGNAFIRYASAYNEKTGHADFNYGSSKVAFLTSFTFSDFGDLTQGSNYYSKYPGWGRRSFYVERINNKDSMVTNSNPQKQVQTGYKQYDFLQKIILNIGKLQNVFNIQYSTSSNIYRYDRLTDVNSAGKAKNAQWYYGPQKRLLAAWHITIPSSNLYNQGQITTAYQHIEESRHSRGFNAAKLNHRTEKVAVFSLNADFKKNMVKSEFSYGAEVLYNKVNSTAYFDNITNGSFGPTDTRYPDGGSNTQSYSLYGTFLNKMSEKIILTSGFRYSKNRLYSKFDDKSFFPFPYDKVTQHSSSLTGNFGFIILPKGGWKVTALLSSGFRTPNVDDMSKVFESGGGTLIIPNPNLRPEKTTNLEWSISKTIAQKYRINTSLWITNYSNALTTDFSTFNGSPTILYNGQLSKVITVVNKNKASLWGISADAAGDINEHFSFSASINYTHGRIKEEPVNYPLDHIAPLFGKAGGIFRTGKFSAEVFTLFNAAKDSSNYNLRGEDNQVYSADPVNGYTPAWLTANLRAAYEITNHATVQFAVENITDKFYRVFASGLGAPGRNFVITLRAKF